MSVAVIIVVSIFGLLAWLVMGFLAKCHMAKTYSLATLLDPNPLRCEAGQSHIDALTAWYGRLYKLELLYALLWPVYWLYIVPKWKRRLAASQGTAE